MAEPAFASARSREPLPSLPSAPWPPRVREGVRGAGRPAREGPPPRGGPGARGGPARAGSGAAPRRGGLAWTLRGGGRAALRAAGGATGPAPPRTSPGGRGNSPRHRPSPGYPEYHMSNSFPCNISQYFSLPSKDQNCSGSWRHI